MAGRSGQLTDVWLDFSGALTGLFLGLILLLVFRLLGSISRYQRLVRQAESNVREQTPLPDPPAAPRPSAPTQDSAPAPHTRSASEPRVPDWPERAPAAWQTQQIRIDFGEEEIQ